MATNKVYASYQEIIDLHTEPDKVSCIGIHTPKGSTPHKMFSGFFDQFKKYKYRGCSITLVPAARLPVDPLQVSYDNPNEGIDARDIMNPLMFHGCHGQDLGAILNNLYSVGLVGSNHLVDEFETPSVDFMQFVNVDDDDTGDISASLLEKLYYKALTDNTWKKAHAQRGFKKSGLRPLIYRVNATHQIMPDEDISTTYDGIGDLGTPGLDFAVSGDDLVIARKPVKGGLQFVANKLTSLGWLDTRNVLTNQSAYATQEIDPLGGNDIDDSLVTLLNGVSKRATLPTVFMGLILLPPAYQVVQHFRMIINHHFAFAGFRGISFQNDSLDEVAPTYFNMDSDDNPEVDPPEPGPGPGPGPEPPTPSTHSVVIRYTMTEDGASVSSEFQTTIRVGEASTVISGPSGSVTFNGLADGTYNIYVADITDHETTYSPTSVVVNGADAEVNLSVEYTSDEPTPSTYSLAITLRNTHTVAHTVQISKNGSGSSTKYIAAQSNDSVTLSDLVDTDVITLVTSDSGVIFSIPNNEQYSNCTPSRPTNKSLQVTSFTGDATLIATLLEA